MRCLAAGSEIHEEFEDRDVRGFKVVQSADDQLFLIEPVISKHAFGQRQAQGADLVLVPGPAAAGEGEASQ